LLAPLYAAVDVRRIQMVYLHTCLEGCTHYLPVTHTHSVYVIHIACAACWLDMQRWMCGGYRWFTHEPP